jgi:hypothetical protein
VNAGIETAEMDAVLAESVQGSLDERRLGSVFAELDRGNPEFIASLVGGAGQFDLAVDAGRDRHVDGRGDGDGHGEALIVVGAVAEQFDAAGGADRVGGRVAKLPSKGQARVEWSATFCGRFFWGLVQGG